MAGWDGPLDILVNNAGVMAIQELTLTDRGQEMQFATNHLGHFALALGLHDALAAAGGARIVSVSSSGHLRSPVVFDDLNFSFRDYDPFGAYGQSKTANVLFAVEATRRWADDGITANALMPGGIATNLQRHVSRRPDYMTKARERFERAGSELKTPEQGAATSVLLAASPLARGRRRPLLRGLQRGARSSTSAPRDGRGRRRPLRARPRNAERLWDVSLGPDRLAGLERRPRLVAVAVDAVIGPRAHPGRSRGGRPPPRSERRCPCRDPTSGRRPGSGRPPE